MFESIDTGDYKKDFVKEMIDCGALSFGEFITKSGRISPYFINTGAFNTGKLINRLGWYYAACIAENIKNGNISEKIDILFGPAYKGIPLAAVTAASLYTYYGLDIGFAFNRKEQKDHGEGGAIVGQKPEDGDNILILDDVITAGTAARELLPVIRAAASVNIAGMIVSVDRMEKGLGELTAVEELQKDLEIRIFPVVTILDIIPHIDEQNRKKISEYMSKYRVIKK